MEYTAEAIVNKLKNEECIAISVRTLNYYAYDKKMFPNLKKGKQCYTEEEYELLKRISFLKEKTSMTLDEIKECITDEQRYNEVMGNIMSETVSRCCEIGSNTTRAFTATNESCCDKTISLNNVYIPDVLNHSDASATSYADSLSTLQETSLLGASNSSTQYTDFSYLQPQVSNQLPVQPINKKTEINTDTTVRINSDITITVSDKVSKEELIDIINFINKNKKGEK